MSLTQGINNAYALTAQINKLRTMQQSGQTYDPQAVEYALQQSFSSMLDGLLVSSNDQNKKSEELDPFSFMAQSNQQAIALQSQRQGLPAGQNASAAYLDQLAQFQNDPTALQNFINANDSTQSLF